MKCEQVKGFLSAYLDSQLALEEREAIATHLQTCAECRRVLVDFRYFDTLLSGLPRVAPDASLRRKNFSSAEYKEITGTFNVSAIDLQHGLMHTIRSDGQRDTTIHPPLLVYSSGTHILVVNMQAINAAQPLKIQGLATALSWSASLPNQLIIALSDGQQGIYLVDTQHDTSLQLDSSNARGPLLWTQIP